MAGSARMALWLTLLGTWAARGVIADQPDQLERREAADTTLAPLDAGANEKLRRP